ncbi:MAG TPA: hypothetical protein VF471_06240 [Pseudoxanthomonas sp.]
MSDKKNYWFPAKTYGWGWGLPTAWQGWFVYGIAAALLVAGVFLFPPIARPILFQLYIWGVVFLLVAVCRAKGEPPRWRWGE